MPDDVAHLVLALDATTDDLLFIEGLRGTPEEIEPHIDRYLRCGVLSLAGNPIIYWLTTELFPFIFANDAYRFRRTQMGAEYRVHQHSIGRDEPMEVVSALFIEVTD